jgi:DNA-directed RNA polymerase subunit RPC12/RpoP
MSKFDLVKCPDPLCGAYNGSKDYECAQCGRQLNARPHKQDAKHDPNRRRQKKRFDDDDGEDEESF